MRRSRRRRRSGNTLNLDSLVDVITNINGMLILLAVFTTIHAMGKTYTVSFPITQPTRKEPVFFECHENRIYPLKQPGGYSAHYYVTPLGSSTMLTLKSRDSGETARQILEPDSAFAKAASRIDAENQYAALLVRSDSFELFRTARRSLDKIGIEVGWEPMKNGMPIILGTSGRSVKPQ